ncbi:hypothetical protein FQ087_07065 [Sporosarcina sp. ANT_H38]|uniref:hypothetical protein n=1 Tax=Sporosarcina sp. ANT_H38 TaxID=2597358 RepID=UPI0011F36885|nr:hypothetical protein [Sporosarcina sp. ANT_H38]KAA0966008.1 hypothetical protein FQ087_07065 [Sporosarcina sp. ANT_H38]
MTNEQKGEPDINPTKVMVNLILIILTTTLIIILSLTIFINIQTSKPLLVDFTNPYELNTENHAAVSSFIEKNSNEMKIITEVEIYDLHRQKSEIQVKEFTSEKEFVRQFMCEELTSVDIDYGGRLVQLKGCGLSSEKSISFGSISY